MELLAGAAGCLAGLLGFAPFLLLGGRIRKGFVEKGRMVAGPVLLVPLLSFVLMIAASALCRLVAPGYLLVFVVPCVVVFLVGTGVYAIRLVKR
ncbi:MAG: hypothetical protein LBL86_08190 [Coriobacteriales bacterium]|nr:hypothetical protein [Coriobacteriales bacterium]